MNLDDYLAALRRQWIVILALGLLGGLVAYGYSQTLPKQYQSRASVLVVPARGENTSELVQGSNYVQNLVQTYTVLATSPTVLNPVIARLGLDESAAALSRRVSVDAPLNTVVLDISVTDSSPRAARAVAAAVSEQVARAVADNSPQSSDGTAAVKVQTIAPASLPSIPSSPNTRNNAAAGLMAGLVVGVAYALLRRRFASRISSTEEVQEVTDLPMLGEVVSAEGDRLVTALRDHSQARVNESLRQVTAGLRFVTTDRKLKVILTTSASSSEGKSSVSLGVCNTLAEIGYTVLYVEADLRRPSAETYTGVTGAAGLTTVIMGDAALSEVIQPWGPPGMSILASGPLHSNPGILLTSSILHRVIDEARDLFDYIVVDTAPVLPVSDALWLAPVVDGCVVVARANRTKREELAESLARLDRSGVDVIGVVLNDVKPMIRSPYYVKAESSRWAKWSEKRRTATTHGNAARRAKLTAPSA
jgi:capsular exopolysaccharide synthesis family protein